MNTTCLKHGRVYVASAAEHRRQGEKQSARANERKRERDPTRGKRSDVEHLQRRESWIWHNVSVSWQYIDFTEGCQVANSNRWKIICWYCPRWRLTPQACLRVKHRPWHKYWWWCCPTVLKILNCRVLTHKSLFYQHLVHGCWHSMCWDLKCNSLSLNPHHG